jgi:hypothetical protein
LAYYITRAAQSTAAVNVYTNLVNDGTGTNVGAIQVPAGVSQIVQVLFSFALSTETATSVGGDIHLRLSGNGLTDGQQEITMGGWTSLTTTSGTSTFYAFVALATSINTIQGNVITPAAAQSGVDTGTQEYSATLVFQ